MGNEPSALIGRSPLSLLLLDLSRLLCVRKGVTRFLRSLKWQIVPAYFEVKMRARYVKCVQVGRLYSPMWCPGGAGPWLIGGGGGCIQGGGIPLGFGGIGGPPMFGIGGGKLWGPPGPWCMPWKFLLSVGPEFIQGGRFWKVFWERLRSLVSLFQMLVKLLLRMH